MTPRIFSGEYLGECDRCGQWLNIEDDDGLCEKCQRAILKDMENEDLENQVADDQITCDLYLFDIVEVFRLD